MPSYVACLNFCRCSRNCYYHIATVLLALLLLPHTASALSPHLMDSYSRRLCMIARCRKYRKYLCLDFELLSPVHLVALTVPLSRSLLCRSSAQLNTVKLIGSVAPAFRDQNGDFRLYLSGALLPLHNNRHCL